MRKLPCLDKDTETIRVWQDKTTPHGKISWLVTSHDHDDNQLQLLNSFEGKNAAEYWATELALKHEKTLVVES